LSGNRLADPFRFSFQTKNDPETNPKPDPEPNPQYDFGALIPDKQGASSKVKVGEAITTAILDQKDDVLSVDLGAGVLNQAFAAIEADSDGIKRIQAHLQPVEGANSYRLQFSADSLSADHTQRILTVITSLGTISIPDNLQQHSNGLKPSTVDITIASGNKEGLGPAASSQIGERPLIKLTLWVDGHDHQSSSISLPEGIKVSIPYNPSQSELQHINQIIVVRIDDSGHPIPVASGKYDRKTGLVSFTANEFGTYGISYAVTNFVDLQMFPWAASSIEALASRGIIQGVSPVEFAPGQSVTRAEYVQMLVDALGLTAVFEENFPDIHTNEEYYNAVGVSKALGIVQGDGLNRFLPNNPLSRQDMFVLTDRALRVAGKLQNKEKRPLPSYLDEALISGYALNSVNSLTEAGLIQGFNGSIHPLGMASRAESAVLLHSVYWLE